MAGTEARPTIKRLYFGRAAVPGRLQGSPGKWNFQLEEKMNPKKKLAPVHPGEVLLEEFTKPLGLSQTRLGRDLGVSPRRINEIVHGKRSVTADTALRLSRYFGTSAEFWLGLQADYDLDTASDRLAERIAREVKVFSAGPEADII
jgi:addiction module HigA family antidote